MEMDVLHSAFSALEMIFRPETFLFLVMGVCLGLIIGVIPGVGGLVGLTLLLPFTFSMDPITALSFMMGLQAVVVTADTIPAVLFGVPGSIGSAATILDGYPMAKKGLARRAFGAAFSSSVIGGLFGALLLGISILAIQPIILEVGTPEMFAICIFGLSLVGVLSGKTPFKGVALACFGIILATIGEDSQSGTLRWTFDSLYLWDGIPIVPLALGLFAIPELVDLAITKRPIAQTHYEEGEKGTRQIDGVKDTFKNWFLVLRCSTIGALLGVLPGIGAAVIDWIAYGHAQKTERGAMESFGTGDVRGVIASESSNNAKEGGSLVPTIAFGVPGSAAMALILGAFLIHGLVPGPEMLTKHLDVTYALVWSIALANILGAGICFCFARQLAKIALVEVGMLVPIVLGITFIGAFQGSRSWGDLYVLIGFGIFGWIMKRMHWPRPPVLLGFVLGGLIERYMFISVERYGIDWLWIWRENGVRGVEFSPYVTIILIATLYSITSPALKQIFAGSGTTFRKKFQFSFNVQRFDLDLCMVMILGATFVTSIIIAQGWNFGARLVPTTISIVGILLLSVHTFLTLFVQTKKGTEGRGVEGLVHNETTSTYSKSTKQEISKGVVRSFVWLLILLGAAALIGILPALFLFFLTYMRIEGKIRWKKAIVASTLVWVFIYTLFHLFLSVPWPTSLLGDALPLLRSVHELNFF